MAGALYVRHSPALAATYADLENHALHQEPALVGTPGAITERSNATGARFYVRQYYDHEGRKRDEYVAGRVDSDETRRLVEEWRRRIADTNDAIASVRLLAREGYAVVAPKHFAAIATLANHRVFAAGAILVGTHAFEVIVNRLGIRAPSFGTEDVDVARPGKLALEHPAKGGLLGLLTDSGIDFVEVPPLRHRDPPTSFKEKGRSRFTFDLLVPASGDEIETQAVPELRAHATALPYLRYLLGETQTGAVLSNHGVAAVRVPVPERFALHKLVVAQIRTGRTEKSRKDLRQAAALMAALAEMHPGALEAAYGKTPRSIRKHIRKSIEAIREPLQAHPRAWETLAPMVG